MSLGCVASAKSCCHKHGGFSFRFPQAVAPIDARISASLDAGVPPGMDTELIGSSGPPSRFALRWAGWTRTVVNERSEFTIDPEDGPSSKFACVLELIGSSGWTRTSNPPVNRLMQVFGLVGSSLV